MEQYEIRVNQLRKLKWSLLFRFFLIDLLIIVIFVVVYSLIRNNSISFLDNCKSDFLFPFVYWLICCVLLFVISFIIIFNFDRNYRKYYVECIYLEAKLEEIYLLDHKVVNNKEINSFYRKVFFLNKIRLVSSFSDASSKYSCDVNVVRYKARDKSYFGTLCSLHYDQEKPGFLELTHHSKCALETYDGKEIIEYGMPIGSILRNFRVFSTYGKMTNVLEKNEYGSKIVLLEKYFASNIDVVFDNENLYVFVPNYRIEISDGLFSLVNNARFMDKIDSIIRFHNLTFDLVKLFDELFD